MKYPRLLERFNNSLAILSGAVFFIVAVIQGINSILRYVFNSPIIWAADFSRYVLIWALFLSSTYAFQVRAHVSVDCLHERIKNINLKRTLTVIGYFVTIVYIVVIIQRTTIMAKTAVHLGKLTQAIIQIPAVYLYAGILVGSIFMLITVIFIILSLIKGEEKYIL